jgi:DNA-binding NarL/FixJ family response regulator
VRIILAEDSALLREGLVGLLERFGHEVVAALADAPALVDAVRAAAASGTAPDLVITDVRMPPGNLDDGLRAAILLRTEYPGLPVVVLSQYVADAYAAQLLDGLAGGVGYLLKDRIGRVADFMQSLEVVARNGVIIDPEMVRHLLRRAREAGPLARLTPREREVLASMAEGRTNGEIARALTVSEAAIAKHIGNIFAKLDLPPETGHRRVLAVLAYLQN